jgi:hypothetical protein
VEPPRGVFLNYKPPPGGGLANFPRGSAVFLKSRLSR